jgi:hypothetical protein
LSDNRLFREGRLILSEQRIDVRFEKTKRDKLNNGQTRCEAGTQSLGDFE